MIVGVGIDIIDVKRFKVKWESKSERFFREIFTEDEMEYSREKRNSPQHFAARFAAKEALFKAMGTGKIAPFKWVDVEIVIGKMGEPQINLHGETKVFLKNKFGKDIKIHISISHIDEYATAIVILEKN